MIINYNTIPSELKEKNNWVCWREGKRNGQVTKLPVTVEGKNADTTKPSTWASFDEAVEYCKKSKNTIGIGFVFSQKDGIVGIDLDKCRDPESGKIDDWATQIIQNFDSYTEVSPSGTGIHVFIKGKKPGDSCRKGDKIEMYETGRYFTVTGNACMEKGIEHRQGELDEFYHKTFGNGDKPKPPTIEQEQPTFSDDDAKLIEKAKSAKDGAKFTALWEGDISGYPSHSEADQALCNLLCFWTGGNRDRIDRLFRQSGLYREDKWGAREDYREKTINTAVNNTTEFYDPQKLPPNQSQKNNGIRDDKRAKHLAMMAKRYRKQGLSRKEIVALIKVENESQCDHPLSIDDVMGVIDSVIPRIQTTTADVLMGMEIPEPRWAIPNFVPEGLTILAGRPKVGKSWLGLGFAVAVASGGHAFGQIPVEQGEALYIGLEDNFRRLQSRLGSMLGDEIPPSKLHLLTELPRLDKGGLDALGDWLDEHPETRLIVIDTLARVRPTSKGRGDIYMEDYGAIGALQKFAMNRGVAILVIHHTRKSEADYVLDEIAGTTGISGAADSIMVLKRTVDGTILYTTGRDVDTQELALRFDKLTGIWDLLGDAKEFAISEQRRAIIDVLKEAGESLAPKDIGEALQKNQSTVRRLLQEMLRNGEIEKDGTKYTHCSMNNVNNMNSMNSVNSVNKTETVHGVNNSMNSNEPNDIRASGDSVHSVHTVHGTHQMVSSGDIEKVGTKYKHIQTVDSREQNGLSVKLEEYLSNCPEYWAGKIRNGLKEGKFTLSVATEASRRMANRDAKGAHSLII